MHSITVTDDEIRHTFTGTTTPVERPKVFSPLKKNEKKWTARLIRRGEGVGFWRGVGRRSSLSAGNSNGGTYAVCFAGIDRFRSTYSVVPFSRRRPRGGGVGSGADESPPPVRVWDDKGGGEISGDGRETRSAAKYDQWRKYYRGEGEGRWSEK